MRLALETLLQLQSEALLQRFAIGGAIAASFYVEAVATEDLEVFAFITPQPPGFVLLTPLYDRIKALGGDYQRVDALIAGGACATSALNALIATYSLQDRWESYVQRHS